MSKFSKIELVQGSSSRRRSVEWPTVLLSIVVYGGWLLLTRFHAQVPDLLLFVLGGWFIAWHSSFQHEIVHGHPTRWRNVNYAFGFPPLALWLPFELYRSTHRLHHRDARLTDPFDDPESKYWAADQWRQFAWIGRKIEESQSTLIGRVLIGPPWMIGRFLYKEAVSVVKNEPGKRLVWLTHWLSVSVVLFWIVGICHMSVAQYLLFFLYPGTAILLMRSFAEHRAATEVAHRTAIIENASLFGLLFLNNNLHSVHHRFPAAAWYALPTLYKNDREQYVTENASLVYNGYGDVISRFLFKQHDQVVHPFHEVVSKVEAGR